MAKKQDEIGEGGKGEETTPETEPETTPEAEPEEEDTITLSSKELNDRINAAKAELGRTLKTTLGAHTTLKTQYDTQGKRLSELEETIKSLKQEKRERELKSVEGTPGLVDSVRLKHQAEDEWEKVTKARSDYEKERSQYQGELDEAAKLKAERKAEELAKASGLTSDLLLQIGSDTAENGRVTYNFKRMEDIAKSVPKGEEEEEEVVAEDKEPAVRGQRARAAGAGTRSAGRGLQTMEDYDKAYNDGRIGIEEYEKARIRFGVAF